MIKKISFALPNMVQADLFSGSLAVWNFRGGAAFARPPIPSRAKRGKEQSKFELFLEYTANQDFASGQKKPSGAERAARIGFERAFLAKRKRIYQ